MANDNYCKVCGAALIRPIEQIAYEQRVQIESIQESVRNGLPTLQQFKQNTLARPNRVKKQQ